MDAHCYPVLDQSWFLASFSLFVRVNTAKNGMRCRFGPICDGEPGRIAVDIIRTLRIVPD